MQNQTDKSQAFSLCWGMCVLTYAAFYVFLKYSRTGTFGGILILNIRDTITVSISVTFFYEKSYISRTDIAMTFTLNQADV